MKEWWQFWKKDKSYEYHGIEIKPQKVVEVGDTAVYRHAATSCSPVLSTCVSYPHRVCSTTNYYQPPTGDYYTRRRRQESDDSFYTGAVLGYAATGLFDSTPDNPSNFEGGGGDFGGGGASGSWD